MQQIEESIERYLSMLDTVDRTEPTEAPAKAARLQDKITLLKEQMQALKQVEVRLQAAPDGQISLTVSLPDQYSPLLPFEFSPI